MNFHFLPGENMIKLQKELGDNLRDRTERQIAQHCNITGKGGDTVLENQMWIRYAPEMMIEYQQLFDEGRAVQRYYDACQTLAEAPWSREREQEANSLSARMAAAPLRRDHSYVEPSAYSEILRLLPPVQDEPVRLDAQTLREKIAGAWVGRIAGCLLGKPLEMLRSPLIHQLLRTSGNEPLCRYVDSREIPADLLEQAEKDPHAPWEKFWIDKVTDGAPVDDDTNYTTLALKLVGHYGRNFRPNDVLEGWLSWLPMLSTCTAERVAYRNAAVGLTAPETAAYRNPYREWIGAQIRADFYGYINPGRPRQAAEMAWRDASISHVKNGIYGAMYVAAMIAEAAVNRDMRAIVERGLQEIPTESRLADCIRSVLQWWDKGKSRDMVLKEIYARFDENVQHDWCHTTSNAMIVTAALLYGEGDFGKSICLAVESAFDTDCNGATVGSIVGMRNGATWIPPYWADQFHHTLHTSIDGYQTVSVDRLVEETLRLVEV